MIVTGPQVIAMMKALHGARLNACVSAMRASTQMLRTDIIANRLSKPRTGTGWVHVPGTGSKVRGRGGVSRNVAQRRALGLADPKAKGRRWYTGVYRKTSGPPMYPQVLSVMTGHLRQSIFVDLLVEANQVRGLVGTNVKYGRYQEFAGSRSRGRRAWLRPALRDNADRIREMLHRADVTGVRVVWKSGQVVDR